MLARGSNLATDWKNTWKSTVTFSPFQDRRQWPAKEDNLGLVSVKTCHQEFPDKSLIALNDHEFLLSKSKQFSYISMNMVPKQPV